MHVEYITYTTIIHTTNAVNSSIYCLEIEIKVSDFIQLTIDYPSLLYAKKEGFKSITNVGINAMPMKLVPRGTKNILT